MRNVLSKYEIYKTFRDYGYYDDVSVKGQFKRNLPATITQVSKITTNAVVPRPQAMGLSPQAATQTIPFLDFPELEVSVDFYNE